MTAKAGYTTTGITQKQAKLTLGAYPAMTLAQARQAHAEAVE
ncbi:integrase arm-type DNA-binding domain-containing protein [Brenneria goodwinii]